MTLLLRARRLDPHARINTTVGLPGMTCHPLVALAFPKRYDLVVLYGTQQVEAPSTEKYML